MEENNEDQKTINTETVTAEIKEPAKEQEINKQEVIDNLYKFYLKNVSKKRLNYIKFETK